MEQRQGSVEAVIEDAIALLTTLAAGSSPAVLSGAEFLRRVPRIERLGRLVDALRVSYAADADARMSSPVDVVGAAGYATSKDAVAQLAGVSDPEAARRIRVGKAIMPGVAISGAPTVPRYPVIAAAITSGVLGVEAADVLVKELDAVARRVDPVVLAETERSLVDLAVGSETSAPLRPALVRDQVHAFVLAIDPDGARPREFRARRSRALSFGEETVDGLIPVSGMLVAEVGGTFKRLVDAHVRRVSFPTSDDASLPESIPVSADDRTPAQRRHDTFADILSAASRVADAPELAGNAPAVLVTVTKATLDDGRGVGYLDGHHTPISVDAVERLIDSRGLQAVTMNTTGRVLSLGPRNGASPRHSGGRSPPATAAASSPAAQPRPGGVKSTTSSPGGPAATPTPTTGCCCVGDTTNASTRAHGGYRCRTASPTSTVPGTRSGHRPADPGHDQHRHHHHHRSEQQHLERQCSDAAGLHRLTSSVRVPECRSVQLPQRPHSRVPDRLNFRGPQFLDFRGTHFPDFRGPQFLDAQGSEIPKARAFDPQPSSS